MNLYGTAIKPVRFLKTHAMLKILAESNGSIEAGNVKPLDRVIDDGRPGRIHC